MIPSPGSGARIVLAKGRLLSQRERLENGVPIPDDLMEQLRAVVSRAGVPFVLG
jgi:hypothetical protein